MGEILELVQILLLGLILFRHNLLKNETCHMWPDIMGVLKGWVELIRIVYVEC